jgi:putative component of membrane protein insertase Oxa1/YidC/SpoIIIJ protein YidD
MEGMPTDWEEDVVKVYVKKRPLVRPNTNVKTALVCVLLFVLAAGVFTGIVYFVLMSIGLSAPVPPYFICAAVVAVESLFCFKSAVIGAIKMYQHYAAEDTRRQCLFMPTCSEYAILAVRKYGVVVGLCKAYYRLVYLCRGNVYKIHYPWDKKLKPLINHRGCVKMSDKNVVCPDCKSNDVQKIEKKIVTSEHNEGGCINKFGWCTVPALLAIGALLVAAMVVGGIAGDMDVGMGVGFVCGVIVFLVAMLKYRKKAEQSKVRVDVDTYYACRSCGHEFRA